MEERANEYRLQKISDIQKTLQQECTERNALSKKYRRSVTIISAIDNVLGGITIVLGATGMTLLSTGIATPVVITLESIAVGTGILRIIGSQTNKKLAKKAMKHEKIKILAEAKLNTITDLVSKALTDDKISDQEYSLILSELEKFRAMKEKIRKKIKTGIDLDLGKIRGSFKKTFLTGM